MTTTAQVRPHPLPILKRWKMAVDGCNVPDLELADGVTRWLVFSRSCVFSMTLTSGLLGLLLAAESGTVNWGLGLLSVAGLVLAHASNNILNDYIDVRQGVDTAPGYPRAEYSKHAMLDKMVSPRGMLTAVLVLNALDLAIMLTLIQFRGLTVAWFAVAGLLLSILYTGVLKRLGVGELTALVVWGPLMIAGTAYVASGVLTPAIWLSSIPYGLIVASVLVGKHIDKIEADKNVGVRTLPAVLGQTTSQSLNKVFFVLFYALVVALVVFRLTGPFVLLTFLAIPRFRESWKHYSKPKPASPPEGWTVWPLWYVGWAMYFNRKAGEYFVLGVLLNVLLYPFVLRLFS